MRHHLLYRKVAKTVQRSGNVLVHNLAYPVENGNADGGMFKKCFEIREPPFPLSIIQAIDPEQRIIHYQLFCFALLKFY